MNKATTTSKGKSTKKRKANYTYKQPINQLQVFSNTYNQAYNP